MCHRLEDHSQTTVIEPFVRENVLDFVSYILTLEEFGFQYSVVDMHDDRAPNFRTP